MPSIRIQRLQSELKKLFNITINETIRDERLSWVTVTEVAMSKDLHYARVSFSTMEDDEKTNARVCRLLTSASGVFKKAIGSAHIMRTIPELTFVYDQTGARARKVEELLDRIKREREEREDNDSE